jgi:hypothetical protein
MEFTIPITLDMYKPRSYLWCNSLNWWLFLFILLTYSRSWALLEEPSIVQPLKNYLALMEPGGSIPCSQEPSTGTYPEPYQSNPLHPILSLSRYIWILSTHLRLGLRSGLFPSGFPTNILYALLFSNIRATWPAHLILLDSEDNWHN